MLEARTAAVTVLVFGEMFYLFNCRSLSKSMFSLGLFTNKWLFAGVGIMITLQLLFIYAPWMNTAFHSAPITWVSWTKILAVGLVLFSLVETEKWLVAKVQERRAAKGV